MNCPKCGKEVPAGAVSCANCGATLFPARSPPPEDSFQILIGDAKNAAKEFAEAAAKVSSRILKKLETAADHPSTSAKEGLKRAAKELDDAAKDLERMFRDL